MIQEMPDVKRWKYVFSANLVKGLSQLKDYRDGAKTMVYRAVRRHKMVGDVG